jgi:hypothetical protein
MTEKESCDWIMRVDLHLPTPDEMPDEMLEIAAAIAWVNYRVEGPGCLWLMVNSCCEPKFMRRFKSEVHHLKSLTEESSSVKVGY